MNYYLDTEFLEGPQKKLFGYTKPTIDLISIGIVAEDGREYYAVSKDFNLKEAWNRWQFNKEWLDEREYWLRENVLLPIYWELFQHDKPVNAMDEFGNYNNFAGYAMRHPKNSKREFQKLLKKYSKSNAEIAEDIVEFTEPIDRHYSLRGEDRFIRGLYAIGKMTQQELVMNSLMFSYPASNPQFYAYFADYDWVVFCWLFGKMIDLPEGFPKYCIDLKQMLDSKSHFTSAKQPENWNEHPNNIKNHEDYPKQDPSKAHNAIEDARWNKQLYEFINQLKTK